MGWGDEVIASGQARQMFERNGEKVAILDRRNRIRTHEAWANLQFILPPSARIKRSMNILVNGPGLRPYIASKSIQRWTWRDFRCPVGVLKFSDWELEWASRYNPQVIIEPFLKPKASPNKQWGYGRWVRLAMLLKGAGYRVSQMGAVGAQRIAPFVEMIHTPTLRHASAVLARAQLAILPEGGLHHTAAAVETQAIVIFGGYISPKQTGYESQINLFTGGTPCGNRISCSHCEEAMTKITPEGVLGLARVCLMREVV